MEPSMDSIQDLIQHLRISAGSSQTGLRTNIFKRKCGGEFLPDWLDYFCILQRMK
jgi:hypothetical protein